MTRRVRQITELSSTPRIATLDMSLIRGKPFSDFSPGNRTSTALRIRFGHGLHASHRLAIDVDRTLSYDTSYWERILENQLRVRRARVLAGGSIPGSSSGGVTLFAAKKALALCAGGEKFDLIICDLMMPT
jgi:hypothetical protein